MKRLVTFLPVVLVLVLLSWSVDNKGVSKSQSLYGIVAADTVKDSIIYYDSDIKTRQKAYKKELQGSWNVVTMRRQQKAELENLSNVSITFNTDMSFSGKAPCNSIRGIYTLKGTSIKFSNVLLTSKMSCGNPDTEQAFLTLLEETVSAYSVDDTKLLLRDGSSNIVFQLERSNQAIRN